MNSIPEKQFRGIWVSIIDSKSDTRLKLIENYHGPIPHAGETIFFLGGEGVFKVTRIEWMTGSEEWYTFSCEIAVEKV